MARDKVQFRRTLGEAEFDELQGSEEDGFACPDCGDHSHRVDEHGARPPVQTQGPPEVRLGEVRAITKV